MTYDTQVLNMKHGRRLGCVDTVEVDSNFDLNAIATRRAMSVYVI